MYLSHVRSEISEDTLSEIHSMDTFVRDIFYIKFENFPRIHTSMQNDFKANSSNFVKKSFKFKIYGSGRGSILGTTDAGMSQEHENYLKNNCKYR